MADSFYFYDLETSGFDPRQARIMQFAGQWTDIDLKPIAEPDNCLIKLTPDVLPDPGAILVTGITPQKTLEEGVTEAEFLGHFYDKIWQPGTIFTGYNSVRFDDEFMRFLMWRNFYDPYEWEWKSQASRWDLLDVVRMTRALRPGGISWPKDANNHASNKLELLTKANKIDHIGAHDALADVKATINLARLIRQKQPRLFDYLLSVRDKKSVTELVNSGQPFVYTSGKYPSEFDKTTVVVRLAEVSGGALVYDLRHDPAEFSNLEPKSLASRWQFTKDPKAAARLPVKTLKYNRCPAIAPLGTLDEPSQERLQIDLKTVKVNLEKLASAKDFAANIARALAILDEARNGHYPTSSSGAEAQLYDGFLADNDKSKLVLARQAEGNPDFADKRLGQIWPRYKARNFPGRLASEERDNWENYWRDRLISGQESSRLANYFRQIAELKTASHDASRDYLLEELQLYGESLVSLA